MRISINKSNIRGVVKAPPSKSYTIRALIAAALACGQSELESPLEADDTAAALEVLSRIGVKIEKGKDSWKVNGGNLHGTLEDLFCRESAATLRFMTAICTTIPGEFHLTAGNTLSRRPITPLLKALEQWGARFNIQKPIPPIYITGGDLKGGLTEIPGDISSQFVSALLLAAPLIKNRSQIHLTTSPESRDYILMTLECLKEFGIEIESTIDLRIFNINPQNYMPTRYAVEGDWSSASYILSLGAINGEIKVENLNMKSLQSDKAIVDILKKMGVEVSISDNCITVRQSRLRSLKIDLNESIDLLPTVAVLASLAVGQSELTGLRRARLKESDRISVVKKGLEGSGIVVKEKNDSLIIIGGKPHPVVIDSRNDHRIAMAFSLMGIVAGDIEIEGGECVSKTYPDYWSVIRKLGAKINE
jgi:3-phosphoshikimate 1-carboxyvinyltransferase